MKRAVSTAIALLIMASHQDSNTIVRADQFIGDQT